MIASRLKPFFNLHLKIWRFLQNFVTENDRVEIPTYATAKIRKENFEFIFTTEPPSPPLN